LDTADTWAQGAARGVVNVVVVMMMMIMTTMTTTMMILMMIMTTMMMTSTHAPPYRKDRVAEGQGQERHQIARANETASQLDREGQHPAKLGAGVFLQGGPHARGEWS
jgi:hypothetical protein